MPYDIVGLLMPDRPRKTRKPSKKDVRTIEEIVLNLKIRRVLEELVNCVNEKKIIVPQLIEKLDKLRFANISHFIPQKSPNISNEATESLVCHLLWKRMICKQISCINSVERKGNRKGSDGGADILVNCAVKIEVKGTSVKKDITTKSKSNADVYALVWVETEDWMKNMSPYVNVRVLYNPHGIEIEHLVSNGENKMRLHEAFEKLKINGLAEELQLNLDEFQQGQIKSDEMFFE